MYTVDPTCTMLCTSTLMLCVHGRPHISIITSSVSFVKCRITVTIKFSGYMTKHSAGSELLASISTRFCGFVSEMYSFAGGRGGDSFWLPGPPEVTSHTELSWSDKLQVWVELFPFVLWSLVDDTHGGALHVVKAGHSEAPGESSAGVHHQRNLRLPQP